MRSALLETLRIFAIIAASSLVGTVLAAAAVATARMKGLFPPDADLIVLGTAAGFVGSALSVPLLWRRRLLVALPLTALPALGVTAGLTLLVPIPGASLALGLVAFAAACVVAYVALPLVYPEPPPGVCPSCGYDLTGLRSPRCPECGTNVFRASPGRRGAAADVRIRIMEEADAERGVALAIKVFDAFVAPDLGPEGRASFVAWASAPALAARLREGQVALVAARGDDIVGLIEWVPPDHIAMLFVDPAVRGEGVGRRLLDEMLLRLGATGGPVGAVSVHASRYAVPFYRRLGFRETGPEQRRDGIVYTPMRRRLTRR